MAAKAAKKIVYQLLLCELCGLYFAAFAVNIS